MQSKLTKGNRGFSLIELIVAVALFSIVMLVSVAALLALVDANRKAQALQSVMNNLNVALDGMVRSIRMGTDYHCGGPPYGAASPCAGGKTFAFESFDGDPATDSDQWVYSFEQDENGVGRIYKSESGGTGWLPITAPEVSIDDMKFYVVGTDTADNVQPKVVISIKGTAGADKVKTKSSFSIQATSVQRILDL